LIYVQIISEWASVRCRKERLFWYY